MTREAEFEQEQSRALLRQRLPELMLAPAADGSRQLVESTLEQPFLAAALGRPCDDSRVDTHPVVQRTARTHRHAHDVAH